MDRPLRWRVVDANANDKLIGEVTASLNSIGARQGQAAQLFKDTKQPNDKPRGLLSVQTVTEQVPTFTQYLAGGMQLQMHVAIDFTASNGDPASPQSLHHCLPDRPSQYEQVIQSVGNILRDYDSDRHFPT